MADASRFVIDLTSEQLPCCLVDKLAYSKPKFLTLNMPLRIVICAEDGLRVAGHDTSGYVADDQTFVFHNVLEDLPELEGEDLQIELMDLFWSAVCREASTRYHVPLEGDATAFLVYPYGYSHQFLEIVRLAGAQSSQIRRLVFVSEPAALILGLLHSGLFDATLSQQSENSSVSIGVVLGYEEERIEAVCFDYFLAQGTRHLTIRDYFRTNCKRFPDRMKNADWRTEADLFCIHSTTLAKPVLETMKCGMVAKSRPSFFRHSLPSILWLKAQGAMHVAAHCVGLAQDLPQYEIVNLTHIGVSVDQLSFYPLIQKEQPIASYPSWNIKAFTLEGAAEGDISVSLHTGYSGSVEESVALGSINITARDVNRLSGADDRSLVAGLGLKTSGSGELILGIMPDDRIVGRLPFTVPGLVC